MPKIAANLTMLFTEVPFLERFEAAAKAGFKYVEFLFPYDYPAEQIRDLLVKNGLQVVLFNLPAGNWAAGERGLGANPLPDRIEEFRAGVAKAVTYAKVLGVPRMNILAGKVIPGVARQEQWQAMVANVQYAADALYCAGLKLVVEAINHYDIPGFFINKTPEVLALINEAGRENVYYQYDLYHAQREEGNLTPTLREHFARIDHIQLADNPGRHQPGTGEINYPFLFAELDKLGYQGFVGLEYIPAPNTLASFGWIKEYGCSLA
jgi:hydroxypyruvate isomerase